MFRAPRPAGLPHLHYMLDDLPHPHHVARYLDISNSTMNRYIRAGAAPRAVMLAMFWETKWGRSRADCEAANAASVYAQYARGMADQNERLKRTILEIERDQEFSHGAANSPIYRVG